MQWRIALVFLFLAVATGCGTTGMSLKLVRQSALPASAFYKLAAAMNWQQRDSLALQQFEAGNIPEFLQKLHPVNSEYIDSSTGKIHHAVYYVTPDYFSIGTNDDWARVPITPITAKLVAAKLGCFLPTRKMVNDIYHSAKVKLEPVPLYAYRDSTPTMYHHHLIIEGQRKGRAGLIAGIKKDVVSTAQLKTRPDRVAIYGWHKSDGRPIQPLYLGHVNWYVDYSHGIRFVHRRIRVDGRWMDYTAVLNHPVLKHLLCDEADCTPAP